MSKNRTQRKTPAAPAPAPVAEPTSVDLPTVTLELKRYKVDDKGRSMFRNKGHAYTTVKFGPLFFDTVPDSLTLVATGVADLPEKKVRMTRDERKAARLAMTPTQKVEEAKARAARAMARAEKLEKALEAEQNDM